jgi:hypothetical protein
MKADSQIYIIELDLLSYIGAVNRRLGKLSDLDHEIFFYFKTKLADLLAFI